MNLGISVLTIFLFLTTNNFIQAQHFMGNVFGTWDADTIYVDGNIDVPLNKSLVITPGTNIYFTGKYEFNIHGTLIANGTEADSIFFFSDSLVEVSEYPYYSGFWYGITLHATDSTEQTSSSFKYCNFKDAYERWLDGASQKFNRRFGGGLIFYKSKVDISNSKFDKCYNYGSSITVLYSSGILEKIKVKKSGYVELIHSEVDLVNSEITGGLGMLLSSSISKIIDTKIHDNPNYYMMPGGFGAITADSSTFTIKDCEITNNSKSGIVARFSNPIIEHTLIKENGLEGGFFQESPITMSNTTIIENGKMGLRFQTISNWATIFTSNIQNCIIAKNNSTGISFLSRNNANIVNCTIADNNSSNGWGGVKTGDVDTYLKNCIVYNNGNNLNFQAGGFYTYSIIQGGYVGEDTAKTNYKNIDPLFRDAVNGDYHLQSIFCGGAANSPAIDAGDSTIGDLLLNCESAGLATKRSDIGAYGGAGNWWDKELNPSCHYSGNVSGVWECEKIYVDGDIIIPQGDTLEIKESVGKVVITGPYQIKVEGVLLAVGTQNDITNLNGNFIKFQGNPEKGIEWKGIIFNNLNGTNVGTSIIENCRFDYASKMNTKYKGGGAIYIYNSDNVIIKHSTFFANVAQLGGAIYLENSNAHIEDCYFDSNGKQFWTREGVLTQAGGAMCVRTSNPYLHKLHFIENYSTTGGGAILVDNSSITITNILAVKNETKGMGGAIEAISNVSGSRLKIANLTSADNIAKSNGGGTFHINGENTELEMINSIMYGNTKVEIYSEGKAPVITYSIIDSGNTKPYYGVGCLDINPTFTEFYKLSSISCGTLFISDAIDAGHPDSLDAVLNCNEGLGTSRADMGFYGGRYSETIVGVENNDSFVIIPNEYKLIQNYPNPFNPTTKIKYSIPNSEIVTLRVYNILGSEVATLVNKKQAVGSYEVIFNASDLTSGIYFYKISTNSFTKVHKMILLK